MSDKYWRKCPMCSDSVKKVDLRSVLIDSTNEIPTEGNVAIFQFVHRNKDSLFPHIPIRDNALSHEKSCKSELIAFENLRRLPAVNDQRAKYSRILESTPEYLMKLIADEDHDLILLKHEAESWGEFEQIPHIDEAFAFNVKRKDKISQIPSTSKVHKVQDSKVTNAVNCDFYSFYQLQNGRNVILHPLNMRCLMKQFEEVSQNTIETNELETKHEKKGMPFEVRGNVLEIEHFVMNDDTRKRFRFLSHLPQFCDFYLCEIDLSHVVSAQTLGELRGEIKKRARQRKMKRNEQERENQSHNSSPTLRSKALSFENQQYWPAPATLVSSTDAYANSSVVDSMSASYHNGGEIDVDGRDSVDREFVPPEFGSFANITTKHGYYPTLGSSVSVETPPSQPCWVGNSSVEFPSSNDGKKKKGSKKGTSLFSTGQRRSYR